jgi:hypothetical protein
MRQVGLFLATFVLVTAGCGSSGSATRSPAPLRGIDFAPATLTCSAPAGFTLSVRYPASVKVGDMISAKVDGKPYGQPSKFEPGGTTYVQQPDGGWLETNNLGPDALQALCDQPTSNGSIDMSAGAHTLQLFDGDQAFAQGSYSVEP